ncbi:hypothetical protein GGR28_002798 [Lewinella aquimaris]|uniref:Uncharacterized protein n=1 Tax=Neolewinella aquimaris TaxID=1835722 RepID=A0A840EDX9_9BACT|nr:hypothetical protein [Neolewinella aquimaris]MBB4080168.1 hypothetical protein [Neolewinella aquimaris]
MKSQPGPDFSRVLLIGGLVVLSLLLLLRVYPPMAFMAFFIGSTVGFFLLGSKITSWAGLQRYFTSQPPYAKDEFSRRVADRLADCRKREERFRDEGERILHSIATLRDDLARNPAADPAEITRAEQVIKEMEAEFSLRHAKASFFADCSQRLRELLDRHRLVESIAARRRELRELRQNNFDDEAAVEETRFSIEQDSIELETIVELSNSAITTDKTSQTEDLRDRLERLRGTLGKNGSQETEAS